MDDRYIKKVTNQKELDEFLNNTTIDKFNYCIEIRADIPLFLKTTSDVDRFNIFDSSIVTFLETPDDTYIYVYDDAVAIIESENDSRVYGFNNSTIINRNENSNILECDLSNNAKLKNESLNPDIAREMYLTVNDISTQEKLDECVKLYQNYKQATFYINHSYSETGSELVVNQKINGVFVLRGESRVVFKTPINSDNKSIDYCISTYNKSTAILETNKCKVIAHDYATIIKRCKDDIAYKYITENAKLIDESHLLDANVNNIIPIREVNKMDNNINNQETSIDSVVENESTTESSEQTMNDIQTQHTPKEVPLFILQKREKTFENLKKNVPQEMRDIPNWCAVKTTYNKETKKTDKMILDCTKGDKWNWAKSNDSTTWTTFDKALEYASSHHCDSLAFCITKDSRIFCVDLDHAKIPSEDQTSKYKDVYSPLVWSIYNYANKTYSERSISGQGLHFFGIKSPEAENNPLFNGKKQNRSSDGKFEIYDTARFMTMTGNLFGRSERKLMEFINDSKLFNVCTNLVEDKFVSDTNYQNRYDNSLNLDTVLKKINNSKYADIFNRMDKGEDVCGDQSRTDMKYCGLLAVFSNGDRFIVEEGFRSSGLFRESKGKSYMDRTIEKAIANVGKSK
jgi:hypothetical protein